MFRDAFVRVEAENTAKIIKDVGSRIDHMEFDPLRTTILACDLSFYPGYRLLDISDHASAPVIHRTALYRPGMAIVLDGTNQPIYETNKKAPISLAEENICDYLRFFMTYVRGKNGAFQIVENVESIAWLEEPPLSARKSVGKVIEPVMIISQAHRGKEYILSACMTYGDNLLRAEIRIDSNGFVEFTNQTILLDGMPLSDDVLERA